MHSKWLARALVGLFPVVLVAGAVGFSGAGVPATGAAAAGHNTWTAAGSMSRPRVGQTATLLASGQVLIVGGDQSADPPGDGTAELYNPNTRTFSATGKLHVPRDGQVAQLLANGKVLVAGGATRRPAAGVVLHAGEIPTATAELYDPATGTWTLTRPMASARSDAVSWSTGGIFGPQQGILVVGGEDGSGTPLATAEVYDPTAGTWRTVAPLAHPRVGAVAIEVALNPGTPDYIYVAGGGSTQVECHEPTFTVPDPGWSPCLSLEGLVTTPATGVAAAQRPVSPPLDVLFLGGGDATPFGPADQGVCIRSGETAPRGHYVCGMRMRDGRADFTATALPGGVVLIAGGHANLSYLGAPSTGSTSRAELWSGTTSTAAAPMLTARYDHTATLLNDGTVLVVGGVLAPQTVAPGPYLQQTLASAEVYTP